jgi:hypothetical protein
MALEIRSDLRSLKEDPEDAVLLDRYRKSARQTAQGIVKVISKSLEMVREHSGVDADRASTCLFIGRLALALMTQSKAMSVLLLNKQAVGGTLGPTQICDLGTAEPGLSHAYRCRFSFGFRVYGVPDRVERENSTRRT